MYNNQFINSLNREKQKIEEMIQNYQNPSNSYINTQISNKDLIEWRVLNENEEVDNLYVQNKTLFINDNMMILKSVDGKTEKWEIKKIWPIDKKDEKINQLEEEIKKLKEVLNEHSKSYKPVRECDKSYDNDDEYAKSKSKTTSKSIPG